MHLKELVVTPTYTKLDWDRKKVHPGFLRDNLTTWDAWEVDVSGLNDPRLPLRRFHKFFGKAVPLKSVQCNILERAT